MYLKMWIVIIFFSVSSVYAINDNENTVTGKGAVGIIQTGDGVINVNTGISEEKYDELSEQYHVTKSALKSFFKILEQKQVPPEDLDSTLYFAGNC